MKNSDDNSRTRRPPDDPRSELLSRAYREAVENTAAEPARSVDDAIRAAAHQAVEVSPRIIKLIAARAILRRWRTPLALAATVLLAIGIALRVYKEESGVVPVPVPAENPSYQKETSTEKAAEKARPMIEEKREVNKSAAAPSRRDAARSGKEGPGEADIGRNKVAPSAELADKAEENHRAETGGAQAPQSPPAERQETQPLAKPFPGAAGAISASPPAREPATVPPAPVPGQATKAAAPSLYRSRTERTQEEKAVATPPTAVQLLAKRLDGRPAETWVEEIRTLKRAGRDAEASELLAAMRKKFPNFTLPDDLK
jgi:hypothetical protein